MKLREIFRYEVGYRLRSGATWAYAFILLLVSMWMFLATADGAGHANAPERIAGGALLAGMFGLLISAAIFGDAAVRDVETGMDPLLFTAPLSRTQYLGGRFLGALVVNALVALAIPLGILLATLLASTGAETTGPIRLAAHVEPYFTLLLPNLVLTGAVLFTIGSLTRQVIPVFLTAIATFIATIVLLNYAARIDSSLITMLLDPLGMATLMEHTELWTEGERNSRMVGLPGPLALNRVLWLGVALAVLALLFRVYRFAHVEGGDRVAKRAAIVEAETERALPVNVPRVSGRFDASTTLRQTLAVARNAFAEVVASRWFMAVLLACVGLTMLWGWNVGTTVFDTSSWPVTLLITEVVLSARVAPVLYVLVALYAGELVWKDRAIGAEQIVDAAPVSNAVALLGRFLTLATLLVLFHAATMLGGILIQVFQGYHHLELGLYLRVVFAMSLVNYLLLAALAMTIHVLVNHKYVGHLIIVLAFAMPRVLPALRVLEHHLLLYGTDPGWVYSDMNGFGDYAAPFAWFKLYWAAWAMLLLVVAVLFWVRGPESSLRGRLRQARARFAGRVARAAGVAIVLVLVLGGFIFYNTNVLNEYEPPHRAGAKQAAYEKRYSRYEGIAQPTITSVDMRIEVMPDERALELRGSYLLENRSGTPIPSVHVFLAAENEARALTFDRTARAVHVDAELGYRIFALDEPLQPGDSLRLEFDVAFRPRGFPNGDFQTDVIENGSSFNRLRMPFIGYQPLLELSSAEARARFGLEPQPPMPEPGDSAGMHTRWPWPDADLVQMNTVVGTPEDQIAVANGLLQRTWTENGRRYVHYRTEVPTAFGATVYAADYAIAEDRWNDVALRVYHHPAHTANVDRMMRGMKAGLEYCTTQFGPYPYSDLRIVETPRYGGYGIAHPHTVGFTEDVFFSRVMDGELDQPFYGTVHEVAHAWWGGMIRGAAVRGASFLTESLANYTAMMVTEKTYGRDAGRRVYGFQMDRYLRGRAGQGREVPVLQVEDQPYIAYRHGALALYMLREHIGEDRVNAALRRYFEAHRDETPPFPTSQDLFAELRAETPDSLRYLLTDWFETVTVWEAETKRAVVERAVTGEYIVTLDIVARKARADAEGNPTDVSMNDLVEIGVFMDGGGGALGETLYLERHRIHTGEQTIRVVVPRAPDLAGIDPYGMLVERNREDDVIAVTPIDQRAGR